MIEQIQRYWNRSYQTIKTALGGSYHDVVHQAQIHIKYLIGEVERLKEIDERESLITISIRDENRELRKALEDQKLRMQAGYKNGYESETVFWIRCIWEIDQTLERMKP